MRKVLAACALGFFVLLWTVGLSAPKALAANGDRIDRLTATYTVKPDGAVRVQETLVYRFGTGQHRGIVRSVVVREPYAGTEEKNRVYHLTMLNVESSPKVPTNYVIEDAKADSSDRSQRKVIKVGDKDTYFSTPVVTYTLTYEISRSVISGPGGDEFYWDVISPEFPPINQADITVVTPSALREISCFVGAKGSKQACTTSSKASNEQATYIQNGVGDGSGMTVGAVFTPGAVTNNQPDLVESAKAKQRNAGIFAAIATAISAAASAAIGWLLYRTKGRDDRFLGMAPGTIPGPGMEANVGPNTEKEIPVAFSPPKIAPEEAGLVMDGALDVRDTTAAILELATKGGLKLGNEDGQYYATLVNPNVAARPHQRVLIDDLFGPGAAPGAVADLSQNGSLAAAHENLLTGLKSEVANYGWYKRMPTGVATQAFSGVSLLILLAVLYSFIGQSLGPALWLFILPAIPLVIMAVYARRFLARGQRSATGRAVADQIEGFRIYLTTAEADQIKFEEGEDIFSRYLPWATIFGVADRWTKICQQLVEQGRLSDDAPSWYIGYWPGYYGFDMGGLTNTLDAASTVASSGSSDGSGGFSSGGGGFSGGGGGGGDVGSW